MKFTIDLECTPEEARKFLGWPDIGPMQETMVTQIQEKMVENLSDIDPETLMKNWMPLGLQGFENMQNMFFSQMQNFETAKNKKSK